MDKKKKEIALFVGSLFVAVIFLTSFMGNGGAPLPSSGSQATQKSVTTFFASGAANAIVASYGSEALVTVTNGSLDNMTNSLLLKMENNGSVTTYSQSDNQFNVYLGTLDSNALQGTLAQELGNGSFSLSSREFVTMPVSATLYVGSQPVPVYFGHGSYSFTSSHLSVVGTVVPLYVSAIVAYMNGTYQVYNGNVSIRSLK